MSTKIQIAVDHVEAAEFAAWINTLEGCEATVSTSTGNFVNGHNTGDYEKANTIMRALWDAYCAQ